MPETIRIGAPTPSGSFLTVVAESGVSGEQPLRTLLPMNEFYWPPPVNVADALNLDAAAQWWRKVGTPTGGVIYTTATAASISTLYGDDLLKVVAAASGDGLKTTWTYANEKRVKSGAYMAVLCAVYLVTAAKTVTISLVSSTPTTIATTTVTTTGSWQLVALEPGATTLNGTSVDFKATLDGAGTFYVIPLGALISTAASPRALPLPNRVLQFCWADPTSVKTLSGLGDEATWTDIDTTAATSALAVLAQINAEMRNVAAGAVYYLFVRRNGSSDGNAADDPNNILITYTESAGNNNAVMIVLDDAQVFEYYLDRTAGSDTLDEGRMAVAGWWEWS